MLRWGQFAIGLIVVVNIIETLLHGGMSQYNVNKYSINEYRYP